MIFYNRRIFRFSYLPIPAAAATEKTQNYVGRDSNNYPDVPVHVIAPVMRVPVIRVPVMHIVKKIFPNYMNICLEAAKCK